MPDPQILVLMGVSGCGKSTVAGELADRLHWAFCEGDELHPAANVAMMAAGHQLSDDDRWPWLERVRAWIDGQLATGESGIVTCSALKRAYRDVLREPRVTFVYLHGSYELVAARLSMRHGHYMPRSLLDSQFADLEAPGPDEQTVTVQIADPPVVQADEIIRALGRADT